MLTYQRDRTLGCRRITGFNATAEELTGWRRDEVLGQPVQQVLRLLGEEGDAPVALPLEVAIAGNRAAAQDAALLLRRDGSRLPVQASAQPLHDAAGLLSGGLMAFRQVNDQLAETLPDDRFITAFVGLLDATTHTLSFHSGGQGPILHWQAARGEFATYGPTSFPLGAMPLAALEPPARIELAPGDLLALLSDGLYEQCDAAGSPFGEARVRELLREHRREPMAALGARLLGALDAFARGVPQEDDVTLVLLRREAAA